MAKRYRRLGLDALYPGHWLEFDATVPLDLFDAVADGDREVVPEFFARAVRRWSFPEPLPAQDEVANLPWDILEAVPAGYYAAHRLTREEMGSILCMVVTGEVCIVPEAGKISVMERLNVPYARSYGEIPAGEFIRVREYLREEAECRAEWKPAAVA